MCFHAQFQKERLQLHICNRGANIWIKIYKHFLLTDSPVTPNVNEKWCSEDHSSRNFVYQIFPVFYAILDPSGYR